jgi:peptidoglycan/LPS O-acetylase OafA/YrhL
MTTTNFTNQDAREITLVSYRLDPAPSSANATKEPAAQKSAGGFHIPSLDGLRGAAFLLVFFGHALPAMYLRFVPPAFGVTVFFVLSGYLITTLLRREFDKTQNISFRDFYLRRALRILPPFYIVLVVSSILTEIHAVDGQVTLPAIFAYVFHGANYWHIYRGLDEIPGGTSVYWSLSVEEHFYMLFPLLYWGMRRRNLTARQQLGVILGLCAMVLAWRLVLVTALHADHDRLYRATDTRVDAILAGCALAVYANPMIDRLRYSDRTWRWVLLPVGLAAIVMTSFIRHPVFQEAIKGSIQAAALIPLFVVAIRSPKWGPMRILNTRLMSFIGLLSYGLYLIHRTILSIVETWVSSSLFIVVPLSLGASIAFCYALHVFVEKPCADMRKRLGGAKKKSKEPPRRMPTPMHPHVAMG